MRSVIWIVPMLFAISCVTNQEIVKNTALYEHNCVLSHLIIGPIQVKKFAVSGQGTVFSVVCQEKGNHWKATYLCPDTFFQETKCHQASFEKGAR